MRTIPLKAAFGVAAAALALAACERDGEATVGQRIDRALDVAQQKLEKAGDRIAVETDRAVSALKDRGDERVAHAGNGGNGANGHDGKGEAKPADGARAPEAERPPGTMSDTAITASIKTDFLKDPDLSVLKIDVDTRGGVVTLNGLAENEEARQRAERIAQAVKGVTEVRNYLVVKRT